MKHISIIVPFGHCSVTNIEGTLQIFNEANGVCTALGKAPLFQVQLVGASDEVSQRNGLFKITPDVLIHEVKKTDLIVIPAMMGDQQKAIEANQPFASWVIEQFKNGAEIASYCIGTFFLASTGLLNGKKMRHALEVCERVPQYVSRC